MQKSNNKKNKDQNTPQFGVVNYGPENIGREECFPNYPELLNIEQQTLPFIYGLFSDYRYDEMIPG